MASLTWSVIFFIEIALPVTNGAVHAVAIGHLTITSHIFWIYAISIAVVTDLACPMSVYTIIFIE